MINDSKVIKHFKNAWKEKRIFVECRENRKMLICDLNIVIEVPITLKLFNDREMFPELPTQPKECFTYSRTIGFEKQGPQIYKLIENLLASDLKKLMITRWLFDNIRLLHNNEKYLFIDQRYLDLFEESYQAYSSLQPNAPIVLASDQIHFVEDVIAIIMPIKTNLTDEDKFPNIPELRA